MLIVDSTFWGERNRWVSKDKDKQKRVPVVSYHNGLQKTCSRSRSQLKWLPGFGLSHVDGICFWMCS